MQKWNKDAYQVGDRLQPQISGSFCVKCLFKRLQFFISPKHTFEIKWTYFLTQDISLIAACNSNDFQETEICSVYVNHTQF